MSSSLSMITCDKPLPSHLSPLDMALWSINNVNKVECAFTIRISDRN